MAKLSRSALKGIVKECLVEILAEGLGEDSSINLVESTRSSRKKKRSAPRQSHPEQRSPVDTVSFSKAVDNTVKRVTNDPVMASLLSDTAATTLQEQYTAGETSLASSGGDEGVSLGGNGLDIFDGAAQNWADLAFSDPKP